MWRWTEFAERYNSADIAGFHTEEDDKDPFSDVEDGMRLETMKHVIDLDEGNSEGSGSNTSSDEQDIHM